MMLGEDKQFMFLIRHPTYHSYSLVDILRKVLTFIISGNISLSHTVVRQADVGIQGDSAGVRIRHSNLYSCNVGIQISDGIMNDEFHQNVKSESIFVISHTKCIYNKNGIYLHGTNEKPYFYIHHCDLSFNTGTGFTIKNWDKVKTTDISTSLFLSKSSMDNNAYYGMVSDDNIRLDLIVDHSSFSGNKRSGIYIDRNRYENSASDIQITNSHLLENHYHGIYAKLYCWHCLNDTTMISGNTFTKNERHQVYVEYYSYYDDENTHVDIAIMNNTFLEHAYKSGYLVAIHSSRLNSKLAIEENTFNNSHGGIEIYGKNKKYVMAVVRNNVFQNVYGATKNVIFVTKTRLNFTENVITTCTVPVLMDLADGINHEITFNNFSNNGLTVCLVNVGEDYRHKHFIFADYNHWGSSDIELIKSLICDVFLDSSKARVLMDYFFPDVGMSSAQAISSAFHLNYQYDSELAVGVIGGVIHSGFNMSILVSKNVIVNRTIIVDETANVLLSGFTFNFTRKRGFVLLGKYKLMCSFD